jgi:hypothetical protein
VNHEARDKAAEVWCEKYCASPGEFEESGQREAFYAGHAAAQKEFEESLRVACAALKTYEEFPGAATVAAIAHLQKAGHYLREEK